VASITDEVNRPMTCPVPPPSPSLTVSPTQVHEAAVSVPWSRQSRSRQRKSRYRSGGTARMTSGCFPCNELKGASPRGPRLVEMWTEIRSEIHQSPRQGHRCVVEGLWRGIVRGVDADADGGMARQVVLEPCSGTLPLTSFEGRVSWWMRSGRFAARRGGTQRVWTRLEPPARSFGALDPSW